MFNIEAVLRIFVLTNLTIFTFGEKPYKNNNL